MEEDPPTQAPPPPDEQKSPLKRYTWMMLIWSLAGLLSLPLGLIIWSELSGAGQDLGFIRVLLQYAVLGLVVGGAVGAALASCSNAIRSKARRAGTVLGVVLLASGFLYFFVTSL